MESQSSGCGLGSCWRQAWVQESSRPINCVVDFGQVITSVCHVFLPHNGDSNIFHLMGLLGKGIS